MCIRDRYTSVNLNDGTECGSGTVYLEKVTTTEFEKEDFLTKKKAVVPHPKDKTTQTKQSIQSSLFPAKKLNIMKPGAEDFVISKKDTSTKKSKAIIDTIITPKTEENALKNDSSITIPEVLIKRENVLSHSLTVDSQDVTIEFYDNGQIDGDTISVYHDNKPIIRNRRLGYTPITMQVHIPDNNPIYEFIEVAENLGTVPPNTALVIVSSGSKHYEINIASDEQRNAKIILQYQKPPEKK